jgi:hypothetical protein
MSKFIQLKRGNDWGKEYLAINPLKKSSGSADFSLGCRFKEGEKVAVKFPDGTEDKYPVVFKEFYDTVHDHGHQYEVTSQLPGIEIVSMGIKQWICLDEVEVKLKKHNLPKDSE